MPLEFPGISPLPTFNFPLWRSPHLYRVTTCSTIDKGSYSVTIMQGNVTSEQKCYKHRGPSVLETISEEAEAGAHLLWKYPCMMWGGRGGAGRGQQLKANKTSKWQQFFIPGQLWMLQTSIDTHWQKLSFLFCPVLTDPCSPGRTLPILSLGLGLLLLEVLPVKKELFLPTVSNVLRRMWDSNKVTIEHCCWLP